MNAGRYALTLAEETVHVPDGVTYKRWVIRKNGGFIAARMTKAAAKKVLQRS